MNEQGFHSVAEIPNRERLPNAGPSQMRAFRLPPNSLVRCVQVVLSLSRLVKTYSKHLTTVEWDIVIDILDSLQRYYDFPEGTVSLPIYIGRGRIRYLVCASICEKATPAFEVSSVVCGRFCRLPVCAIPLWSFAHAEESCVRSFPTSLAQSAHQLPCTVFFFLRFQSEYGLPRGVCLTCSYCGSRCPVHRGDGAAHEGLGIPASP